METATQEKKINTEPKKIYGSYLRNEIVAVKPVESNGKWSNLLVKGQEKNKDPFILNKAKKGFGVPLNSFLNGGGVKVVLDDNQRILIKKYEAQFPNGMTQKEFFEKELGINLSTNLPNTENFWRSKKARVTLTREGIKLNLNQPMDMLRYLILLSNADEIAPSYDERKNKLTYEFMMVNESKVQANDVAEARLTADAYIKFAEITRSKDNTVGFIKSLGRVIPVSAKDNKDWLEGEVLKVLKADPKKFLEIVNHPQYNERIFVQDGVDAGAIKRLGEKRYTLDNGVELGDLTQTINYLLDPANQQVRLLVQGRIDLMKNR